MSNTLERTLGLRDLVLLVVGVVIGSGIFLVPGVVLRQTGGAIGPALLVWLFAGVLSLLGALTYGEMGAMNPEAGGIYVYIRDAFGRRAAFLYGWTVFFVISTGSVATLAVAFASYLEQLVPVGAWKPAVAVGVIAVVAALNVRGTRESASVQNWSTLIKAGAIVIMSVLLLARGDGLAAPDARWWPDAVDASLASAIGLALVGVLWAYEGWQYVTCSAGEARDPQRTFPRGMAIGTAALIGIYLLANVGYIAALGPTRASGSETIAADAVGALLGPTAARLVAVAILISMWSAANSLVLTSPRIYYAMARDGIFFRRMASVHPRFRTPAFAIVASCAWSAVLAATGTFEQLLTYVVFGGWIFYALGALAIFAYRRKQPIADRPFRVPGYPLTPALFVVASAVLVLNTLITQPRESLIGLGIVLLGLPAYEVWKRGDRRGGGDRGTFGSRRDAEIAEGGAARIASGGGAARPDAAESKVE